MSRFRSTTLLISCAAFWMLAGCAEWLPGGDGPEPEPGNDQPPIIIGDTLAISDPTPGANQQIRLLVNVAGGAGDTLTFDWEDSGPTSGVFTGDGPDVFWATTVPGTYTLSVTVRDEAGVAVSRSETVVVGAAIPTDGNASPVASDGIEGDVANPVAGQVVVLSAQFNDPDGDSLQVIWSDGTGQDNFTNEQVGADGEATVEWRPPVEGSYTLTATASDGIAASAAASSEVLTIGRFPATFSFVGAARCAICHEDEHAEWQTTGHHGATETLASRGLDRRESCMVCHSTGKGQGGMIDVELTPQFTGVQCESCHGSGVGHPANGPMPVWWDPEDNCAHCHNETGHYPTFEQWQASTHASFDLTRSNTTNPACIRCHNGKWFVKIQIEGEAPPEEALPAEEASHIVCATCHDPHNGQFSAELRTDSEADVILPFDNTPVNAGIGNICIHCHNGRRTRKNMEDNIREGGTRFGVHANNQGNMYFAVGAIEFEGETYDRDHPHKDWIDNRCITCHMERETDDRGRVFSRHTFFPQWSACLDCHVNAGDSEEEMAAFAEAFQDEIRALMAQFVEVWPDEWKDTSDPEHVELVSAPNPDQGLDGPPVDDPIGNQYREALWNYVYVEEDFSFGIHNPTYAKQLLQTSIAKVEELNAQQ